MYHALRRSLARYTIPRCRVPQPSLPNHLLLTYLLGHGFDLCAVGQEVVAHGQQPQLRRREPQGEVAGGALDEHAEEALERAEDGAVQHDGLRLRGGA
eukprot:scaffold8988_cov50-Phaeocystis_antarctica.AAC.1